MKIIPNFTPRLTWAKVYTRFQTKTTQKPYPLGRHIPIWLIQGSRPPPPPRAAFIIVFERRHISYSCLPFTLANWSVHGFGKLYSNSGLENFVPESRLPFLQISSIYPKTTAVSKMALKKWNTNSAWNIPSGRTGLPFQMFRCSRKFFSGTTQKVVFHLLSNRIFRKLVVKQPKNAFLAAPG